MQDRIGEVYDGTVSGVTSFGLFVTLDKLNVDGLVHVTELGRDYFRYDAARHEMKGERSGVVYRLAARLRVRVARVDLEQSKIDFVLADDVSASAVAPHAGRSAGHATGRITDKVPQQHSPGGASAARPSVSQPLSREDLPPRAVKVAKGGKVRKTGKAGGSKRS